MRGCLPCSGSLTRHRSGDGSSRSEIGQSFRYAISSAARPAANLSPAAFSTSNGRRMSAPLSAALSRRQHRHREARRGIFRGTETAPADRRLHEASLDYSSRARDGFTGESIKAVAAGCRHDMDRSIANRATRRRRQASGSGRDATTPTRRPSWRAAMNDQAFGE